MSRSAFVPKANAPRHATLAVSAVPDAQVLSPPWAGASPHVGRGLPAQPGEVFLHNVWGFWDVKTVCQLLLVVMRFFIILINCYNYIYYL